MLLFVLFTLHFLLESQFLCFHFFMYFNASLFHFYWICIELNVLKVNSSSIVFIVLLDWMSLMFMSFVLMIS